MASIVGTEKRPSLLKKASINLSLELDTSPQIIGKTELADERTNSSFEKDCFMDAVGHAFMREFSENGQAEHVKKKIEADTASAGNGRRPQPRFLSRRLRFCPAAMTWASQLTRQSHRKRKRLMPCQSLASVNKGSTHTFRLFMAFW